MLTNLIKVLLYTHSYIFIYFITLLYLFSSSKKYYIIHIFKNLSDRYVYIKLYSLL